MAKSINTCLDCGRPLGPGEVHMYDCKRVALEERVADLEGLGRIDRERLTKLEKALDWKRLGGVLHVPGSFVANTPAHAPSPEAHTAHGQFARRGADLLNNPPVPPPVAASGTKRWTLHDERDSSGRFVGDVCREKFGYCEDCFQTKVHGRAEDRVEVCLAADLDAMTKARDLVIKQASEENNALRDKLDAACEQRDNAWNRIEKLESNARVLRESLNEKIVAAIANEGREKGGDATEKK